MIKLNPLIFALFFSLWAWIQVVAQSGTIIFPPCDSSSGMQWAFNKENQSPCQVAAILQGLCFGNAWNLSAILPGQEYGGPTSLADSNVCQCNTVAYSLVSACGACQNAPFPTWPQWRKNCSNSDVTIAGFPGEIPPHTGVPAWAYINVTSPVNKNTWNKNTSHARALSNPSETTGGALPPKSISKTLTSMSPGTDTTVVPSPTEPALETSSKSKAGPIAGGVVGGLVGLAALAFVAFILYRKSYRPKQTVLRVNEKVDIGGAASPAPTQGTVHTRTPSAGEELKLYNPSDPSTFPPSPFPTFATQNAQTNPYGPLGRVAARSGASGYSGIPEV